MMHLLLLEVQGLIRPVLASGYLGWVKRYTLNAQNRPCVKPSPSVLLISAKSCGPAAGRTTSVQSNYSNWHLEPPTVSVTYKLE